MNTQVNPKVESSSKFGVKHFVIPVALILFASLIFAFGGIPTGGNSASADGIGYKGYVCVYKNGQQIDCGHNLLYSNGRNLTRDILGNGATGAIQTIQLCNATAGCGQPVADGSEPFTPYTNCGLTAAAGSYTTLTAVPGNWTITKTFTATCDNLVLNATRLENSTNSIFAGNVFTTVTLQTNDQLTINWTLSVQ